MKYSFLSIAIAALALPAVLFSFSANAASEKLTPGAGMLELLSLKKSGKLDDLLNGSGPAAAMNGVGGSGQSIQVACSYRSPQFPIIIDYSSSYLNFVIYSGSVNPFYTPYDFCHRVARDTCNFLLSVIGVPAPLDVVFRGNILQTTKRCGTF